MTTRLARALGDFAGVEAQTHALDEADAPARFARSLANEVRRLLGDLHGDEQAAIDKPPSSTNCRLRAAANLIERVLPPQSGLRQWVLTFPFSWRRRLAQDGALLGRLTRIVVETVLAFYLARAAQGGWADVAGCDRGLKVGLAARDDAG